ncbi:MAG: hypothetical protein D6685_16035, partial [Bacteroidetes bacterium]
MPRLPRFAVFHVFAAGPPSSAPAPVHIGLLPITAEAPGAVVQDWVVNPGEAISRRLYEAGRVSTEQAGAAPPWEAVRPRVQEALAGFDAVFVFDTGYEAAWIQPLLDGPDAPLLVDLRALAEVFLPHRDLFDLRRLCELTVPGYRRSEPQLPFLLQAFRTLLADVAAVLLTPAPDLDGIHPAYAWLQHAVEHGAPAAFGALEALVDHAHA